MFPAFLGGTIAGAVGAGVWAAVALVFDYEIGWIAWGIGALVGFGVAWGNRGHGFAAAGVLAGTLAVLSIATGKYFAYQTILADVGSMVDEFAVTLDGDQELLISYMADEVGEELEAAGQSFEWPTLAADDYRDEASDYPPAVWSKAMTRWNAMSVGEQQEYRDGIVAMVTGNVSESMDALLTEASFLDTFGLYDIVFLGLAVWTAARIAGGGLKEEELVTAPATTA